jgi:hypothetical protein
MKSALFLDCCPECRNAECCNAECCYAECCYAECRYAECQYAECIGDIINRSISHSFFVLCQKILAFKTVLEKVLKLVECLALNFLLQKKGRGGIHKISYDNLTIILKAGVPYHETDRIVFGSLFCS